MIIDGLHVTAMIVDGVPYLTARNLSTGAQTRKIALVGTEPTTPKEMIPKDWDDAKMLECVVASYEHGNDVAARQFKVDVKVVAYLVTEFENGAFG